MAEFFFSELKQFVQILVEKAKPFGMGILDMIKSFIPTFLLSGANSILHIKQDGFSNTNHTNYQY